MPLARALTWRLRSDSGSSTRTFIAPNGKSVRADDISLPINLLSTTNILSHEAPDVAEAQLAFKRGELGRGSTLLNLNFPPPAPAPPKEHSSATQEPSSPTQVQNPGLSSSRSSEDSHASPLTSTSPSTSPSTPPSATPTLTDVSSADSSPGIEYNHLSCYFPRQPTIRRSKSAAHATKATDKHRHASIFQPAPVPQLPQRVPSHSKKEHVRLARKRSVRSGASSPVPGSPLREEAAVSNASQTPSPVEPSPLEPQVTNIGVAVAESGFSASRLEHTSMYPSPRSAQQEASSLGSTTGAAGSPFSQELEKLNEVVEEFHGVGWDVMMREDQEYIERRGLGAFGVDDYVQEVGWENPFVGVGMVEVAG